jgi:hypothetical protein
MKQKSKKKKKEKPILITGHGEGCEMSRVPHFLDNLLKDGNDVVSHVCRPCFTPTKHFLVLISVRG